VVRLACRVVQQPTVGRGAAGPGGPPRPPAPGPRRRAGWRPGCRRRGRSAAPARARGGGAPRWGVVACPATRSLGSSQPAPQQLRQAALVAGILEAAVGRPAVGFDRPDLALAEHGCRVGGAAATGDPVDGDLRADQRPLPRRAPPTRQPVSSPATTGLARTPAATVWSVGWARPGGPSRRLEDPTGGDLDAELAPSAAVVPAGTPNPLGSQAARATARGAKLGSWPPPTRRRSGSGGRPGPGSGSPAAGPAATPPGTGSPPAPAPAPRRSQPSTPATRPERPGRGARVGAGGRGCRRRRRACALAAWDGAPGRPWSTAPPGSWPPGPAPPPRPPAAG
jgi:hypothetical protein